MCEQLERQLFEARVLAVFDNACDLVTSDRDVIALVSPRIGDGPLNIVVDVEPGDFTTLKLETTASLGSLQRRRSEESLSHKAETLRRSTAQSNRLPHLQIGDLQVLLDEATVWEPRPDWDALRTRCTSIRSNLALLHAIALHHAPLESLLNPKPTEKSTNCAILTTVRQAAVALRAGWDGDMAQLHKGVKQLAGLGTGLTPTGDDFLVGVMVWARLAHPTPDVFCETIVETAVPRTTTLSAAFLRFAAKGECSAAWHQLLAALATGSMGELDAATRQILAHGATSGADALAGFLWMNAAD